jgi:hypothetical protein
MSDEPVFDRLKSLIVKEERFTQEVKFIEKLSIFFRKKI